MSICSRGSIGNSSPVCSLHDGLEPADDVLEVLGVEVEVEVGALLGLDLVEGVLEQLAVDVEDGLAEHLDQPPVGVPGEPLAAGLLGEALHRLVVEADVEDGLHHPGHGGRGPGADRHQQRVGRVAERLAHGLLERGQVLADLGVELGRRAAVLEVVPAGVGGDGEAGRDGQAQVRHLGEVGALAAEQVLLVLAALAEVVDPLRRLTSRWSPLTPPRSTSRHPVWPRWCRTGARPGTAPARCRPQVWSTAPATGNDLGSAPGAARFERGRFSPRG